MKNLILTICFLPHYFLQYLTRPIKKERILIRHFIAKHIKNQNIKILDFGCGEGIFSNIFKGNKKVQYIGTDKNFIALKIVQKIGQLNSFIVNNENTCFKDKTFDFIVLSNVLHHIEQNKIKTLTSELKRLSRPGAFVLITELVPGCEQKGIVFRLGSYIEKQIKNIRYCNKEFFHEFFYKDFKEVSCQKISNNYITYIFTIK